MAPSYLLEYVAKTESESNPLPWFFMAKSLEEFDGHEEERLLFRVRVFKI